MEKKILLAMVGGSAMSDGTPMGLLEAGMCVPLAAFDETMIEFIESIGETDVGDWIADNKISPPPTGGLWVFAFLYDEDSDAPKGVRIDNSIWRRPTINELKALLESQVVRSSGKQRQEHMDAAVLVTPTDAQWCLLGALV